MAARAIHLHKNSLGNVFFHAIGDDICFGLGTINILRYDFPFFRGGALCVEMGFTWTFPSRNQNATVKLKSELISIK